MIKDPVNKIRSSNHPFLQPAKKGGSWFKSIYCFNVRSAQRGRSMLDSIQNGSLRIIYDKRS
ncbi:MAG: hypothetical protein ACTSYF_05120 [Promethearchaeota archaeon]